MNTKLNEAIHELAVQYNPPSELKDLIMKKNITKRSFSKMKVLLSVAIIALTIPLFAFVKQFYYADQLYGSYNQLESNQIVMSMGEYNRLNNKIGSALQTLEVKDGIIFIGGLKNYIQFKLEHTNQSKGIIASDLTDEQYKQYYNVVATVQPYFDLLNGLSSSTDVLSEEEFKLYIESIILQESIIAQSNVGYEDYDYSRVAPEYEEQYAEVIQTIAELESKLRLAYIIDGVDYTIY